MASCAQQFHASWIKRFPPGQCVTAQVSYDPHYIGFNNQYYDVHPTIDAILFKTEDFEIHAKHQAAHNYFSPPPTVVNSIAMKIKSHKLQYRGSDNTFLADGQPVTMNDYGLGLYNENGSIWAAVVREHTYCFHIYTELGARITVYNARGYNLNVTLTLPREQANKASPSLFGNLTGGHAQVIQASGIFV